MVGQHPKGSRPSSATGATTLDSWSCISEKTVFILDRSPYFTHVSSGHSIIGDSPRDPKKSTPQTIASEQQQPILPFERSLWTCAVEAVVGYSRLVWDLFAPDQKCISLLAVGPRNTAPSEKLEPIYFEKICGWQEDDQNLEQLMKSLGKLNNHSSTGGNHPRPPQRLTATNDVSSYPNCTADFAPMLATLDQGLNELIRLTSSQNETKLSARLNSTVSTIENNGRIVLISSFKDEANVAQLVNKFESMLQKKNQSLVETLQKASASSMSVNLSPINYCDLVIVNTFPIGDEGPCSKVENSSSFRPQLHHVVYSIKSGPTIAGLLNNLCLQHHNLKSTTITGIPMKEEQNAGSSSQYDVEIVHCSSIHEDIINSGNALLDGIVEMIDRNGFPCDTFKLNWCTPRSTSLELSHCVATSRITAVDVNSRPSSCLTNFLLNGRYVTLEIFKSKSNRMTTHILSSHNGELFIHSLAITPQKLNMGDPPSIADSLGGKVGDYRLNDFIAFMKQHTLQRSHITDKPLQRTMDLIKRQTLYWPLTIGHTILFNVPYFCDRLLDLLPKEALTPADVASCKKNIDNLCECEKNAQALPSLTLLDLTKAASANSKGNSRLELLYSLFWNELEHFVRVCGATREHDSVLEHLLMRREGRHAESERGGKRTSGNDSSLGPLSKRSRVAVLPEISDPSAASQPSTPLYKTGVSLQQTWMHLYHHYHQSRAKLPFACRQPPPPPQGMNMEGQIDGHMAPEVTTAPAEAQ